MFTAPKDLGDDQVANLVRTHWGVDVVEISYAAVGQGSHNWRLRDAGGSRWFAKAGRSGVDSDFFLATHRTAAALSEGGLDCVLAPVRDRSGEVRRRVLPNWDLALFPFIEGRNPDFRSPVERSLIAAAVGRLHAFTPPPGEALRWTPGYLQPELRRMLSEEMDRPWADGPYGEGARSLLLSSRPGIERLLSLSDQLVDRLGGSDDPWVMTHGEPHGGNTMLDTSGRIHLIDCDAAMVAPRERDLRLLLYVSHRRPLGLDGSEVLAAYRREAGPVEIRTFVLELFRVEWHLMEICRYGRRFSGSHDESADDRAAWRWLGTYLPVAQNWPDLPA